VSTDHRGERSYQLTPAGRRWLERQKPRHGESR
jgi:DNA-binding PadR family transcriptional regulator